MGIAFSALEAFSTGYMGFQRDSIANLNPFHLTADFNNSPGAFMT
jgi:hypothetical protein